MPNFEYTIKDATGSLIPGASEAENEEILRRRLTEQGKTSSDRCEDAEVAYPVGERAGTHGVR